MSVKKCISLVIILSATLCLSIIASSSSAKDNHPSKKNSYTSLDANKRPVIGVLTEPIRGDTYEIKQAVSYIPKAHVQFLEQTGVRVVPVDYKLST